MYLCYLFSLLNRNNKTKIMKKILLILFVFLGLQAQSQVIYCDSVSISISGSTPTTVTYTTLANPYMNTFLYSFDINWNVTNFNTGAFITSDSVYNPTFNLNNLDTVLVCATAIITGQGMTFTCILCDTILYNGGWMMMSIGQPIGIEDIQNTDRQLFKIVDILGRDAKGKKNQPLFYIYDDGTVEKRIVIE